jgi:predicted AAA+ superfamily ATPase
MRTNIAILSLIFLVCSCKKETTQPQKKYTCTCKVYQYSTFLYTSEESYQNVSYDQAKSNCDAEKKHQQDLVGPNERDADCTLH